jgi:hypothetical protein
LLQEFAFALPGGDGGGGGGGGRGGSKVAGGAFAAPSSKLGGGVPTATDGDGAAARAAAAAAAVAKAAKLPQVVAVTECSGARAADFSEALDDHFVLPSGAAGASLCVTLPPRAPPPSRSLLVSCDARARTVGGKSSCSRGSGAPSPPSRPASALNPEACFCGCLCAVRLIFTYVTSVLVKKY